MKRLTLLIMFILAAVSVQGATLCSSGCDYALLENATAYLNDSADTLYINESGTYYLPTAETIYVNDSSTVVGTRDSSNGVIHIIASDITIDCNGTKFVGNNTARAQTSGAGLIINHTDNVTIRNCVFANYTYGIIARYTNDSNIINTTLEYNRYGAVDFTGSISNITNSTSRYNSYGFEVDSQGTQLDVGTHPSFVNVLVDHNVVDGITVNYAMLTLLDSNVSFNGGGAGDSGILVEYSSVLSAYDSYVAANDDQGIYFWADSVGYLYNLTITNQTYAVVTEDNVTLTVYDSNISNSTYAVFDYGDASVTSERTSVTSLDGATDYTLNDFGLGETIMNLRNMTYNSSKVSFGDSTSYVQQYWYYALKANDTDDSPDNLTLEWIMDINMSNVSLTYPSTTLNGSNTTSNSAWRALRHRSGGISYYNYTLVAYGPGYILQHVYFNLSNSTLMNITMINQTGILPYSGISCGLFDVCYYGNTTEFKAESNLENVSNATLAYASGQIYFPGANNFSGADLDDEVSVSFGLVGLNSSELPALNVSARITMYNLSCPVGAIYSSTFTKDRLAALQGGECTTCSNIVCNNGELWFNVSQFSSYAIGTNANLTILDDTDTLNRTLLQQISFYANYTNNSNTINDSGIYCEIAFNLSGWTAPVNMTFNQTAGRYEYNRSFNASYNTTFYVHCDGLILGFEELNTTDNLTLTNDTTAPTVAIQTWNYLYTQPGDAVWTILNVSDDFDMESDAALGVLNSSGVAVFTTQNWSRTGTLYNISFSVPALAEGLYLLNASALDDSGNNGTEAAVNNMYVDISNPQNMTLIYLSSVDEGAVATFSTSWLDSTPMNVSLQRWNGTNWIIEDSEITSVVSSLSYTTSVGQGNTTPLFRLMANDSVGLTTVTDSLSVAVNDTTDPVITVVSPTNVSTLPDNTTSTLINISTDEIASCRYNLSNFAFTWVQGSDFTTTGFREHTFTYNGLVNNITYDLYYICVDSFGNNNTVPVHHQFSVASYTDTTAPVITITNPTNASLLPLGTTSTTVNITTDENATCKYSTSSGFDFYTQGTTFATVDTDHYFNLTSMIDGANYTYYYKCNDSADNPNVLSVEHSFGVTPDTTSPNASFSSPTPDDAATIIATSVSIRINVSEVSNATLFFGGTPYSLLNVTGGSFGTLLNRTVYSLADGTYSYYAQAWDVFSNYRVTATRTVTIDGSGPIVTFSAPQNGSTVSNQANVALQFSTNEAATCSVTARKTGATTVSASESLTATSGANTSFVRYYNTTSDSTGMDNYFTIQCTDRHSNAASYTTYYTLTDTVAPTLTFVYPTPTGGASQSSTVRINATTNEALGSVKQVRIDGGTYSTLSGSSYYYYTFTGLNSSSHTVQTNISDAKGNLRSQTVSFTIDTTKPEIEGESPGDGKTLSQCYNLLLNVTSDEEVDCEFVWYLDEEEDCKDECDDDYDSCYERADDATERNDCKDDRDDCYDDCEDDKYEEIEEDDLDEDDRDACDDCIDMCEETCEDDEDDCMDRADDNEEEDECEEEYDECVEEDCPDDCEDECLYSYSMYWDACMDDADYLIEYMCEDDAGNSNTSNVSFTVRDRTAPKIVGITDNGTFYSESVTLYATTNEPAMCKYSTTKTTFAEMEDLLTGEETSHTKVIKFDDPGDYTYNFACNDSKNNIMTTYNTTSFTVQFTQNPYAREKLSIAAGDNKITIDKDDVPISSINIKSKGAVTNEVIEVEVLPAKPSGVSTPPKSVYKYLEITKEKLLDVNLDSANITFKVPKSWISAQGYSASQIVLAHYTSGWKNLPTTKLSETALDVTYNSETTSFSYFAITAKDASTTTTPDATTPTTPTTPTPDDTTQVDEDEPADTDEPEDSGFSLLWIVLGILGAVGAGGMVYMTVKSPKPPADQVSVALTETEELISSSLTSGVAVDDVRDSFIHNGWSEEDFETTYQSYLTKTGNVPSQPTEPVSELSTFVKQCKDQGMNKDDTLQLLMSNGWPQNDIEQCLEHFTETTSMPKEEQPADQESAPDLSRFITDGIDSGRSSHEIVEELLNEGWPKDQIMEEIRKLEGIDSNHPLKEFVRQQLDAGLTADDIKKSLKSAGWSDEDIVESLR